MPPQITSSEQDAAQVACDAVIVGAFASKEGVELGPAAARLDASLDGYLAEYLAEVGFKGKRGGIVVVPTFKRLAPKSVVVAGLGKKGKADQEAVRRAAGVCARKLNKRSTLASTLHSDVEGSTAAAVEGFLLGSYRTPSYKHEAELPKLRLVELLGADHSELERGIAFAEATVLARDLTNEPASVLTPDELATRARKIGDGGGLDVSVMDEDALTRDGFGGLLAVGSGSTKPPRLIVMRYVPEAPNGKVALIGKGVTFDSGGLSLKEARGMEAMKTDMAGAAAVIGGMSALARLNVTVEVLGVIPATENMPGGSALRPGDVITHYGGRTTEVLNTDAEGRLILADALAYASQQEPDAIVDVATLTGAMTIALGSKITGAFSNDDDLWQEIEQAAREAGEPIWRMPLVKDYEKSLDSDVADTKNIGTRFGGAIVAALFLRSFVGEDIPWAHLDIAGTGRSDSTEDEGPKGGTGVATRTLLAWLIKRGS